MRYSHGLGSIKSAIGVSGRNYTDRREMYMNCAYLKVMGTSASYTAPKMFVANVGQCTTSEGVELVFPNRGKNVQYGGGYAGQTNVASTPDCAAGNSLDVTVVGNGASGDTSSSSQSLSTRAPTLSTSTRSASSSTTRSSSTTSSRPATTSVSGCRSGSIQCSADGKSWSVCVNSAFVSIGAVSSGTKCVNGAIVCDSAPNSGTTPVNTAKTTTPVTSARTTVTSSTQRTTSPTTSANPGGSSGCTSGQIKCATDGKSWSMCSNNNYIFMGAVAPGTLSLMKLISGTTCVNGKMQRR